MAAKESSDDVFAKVEILTEQVQQLASHRLGTSVHTLCAKALEKRKRKWRRKHQAINGDDSASDINEGRWLSLAFGLSYKNPIVVASNLDQPTHTQSQ